MARVAGLTDIFAIGHVALISNDPDYPKGHPQIAQPAIQMGKKLAANLSALVRNESLQPFKYFDKGDMAIIGRTKAMADLFKLRVHISGPLGLMIWLFIHLLSLVSFRNKFITLYDWVTAYISKDKSLRMIFRTEKHQP
ncbi:hypothetical protein MTO98_30995 [Mucilaginibacter sp. SMC90]|uniref:hypothetical protein n=1 Tax=Mucilaginibacter sp. SMC90 TaxID=2929803 RepID=UPI001FB293B3|nr:hypothetical protein [Mucilaginibacter sp. SMC90]UOE48829.1 hypothetical protein MTO98_30995 [Mucilaginibacter sp. SMC90]